MITGQQSAEHTAAFKIQPSPLPPQVVCKSCHSCTTCTAPDMINIEPSAWSSTRVCHVRVFLGRSQFCMQCRCWDNGGQESGCAPLGRPAGASLGAGAVLGVLCGLLAKAAAVGVRAADRVGTCTPHAPLSMHAHICFNLALFWSMKSKHSQPMLLDRLIKMSTDASHGPKSGNAATQAA